MAKKTKLTTAQIKRDIAFALTNTEGSLAEGDPETVNALDAVESGRKDAYKMLPGARATISIGSDSYEAKIVSATPSLHTIVAEYTGAGLEGDRMTFRKTPRGYRNKHYRLSIGFAQSHRDPSF